MKKQCITKNDSKMKQSFLILVSLICIVAAYSIGRKSNPDIQAFSEKLAINANGILAYEHYYECAEAILENVSIKDTLLAKDIALAKRQIEEYSTNHVMTWPEIVDQRDQLSDIIRVTKEKHPEIANEIDEYLRVYFIDPDIISNWCYSY